MARYYPAFVDVAGRRCVVIGGGKIGEEKARRLLDCGAVVTIVSPCITSGTHGLVDSARLAWISREYQPGDLKDALVAVVATNDSEVNEQVASEGRARNALVNVADAPDLCTFIAPSVVRRGEVTVAFSTGGASPALARKLREQITESRALEYADLAPLLSEVRAELRRVGAAVDPGRWQRSINEDLLRAVQAGRIEEARRTLISDLLEGDVSRLGDR